MVCDVCYGCWGSSGGRGGRTLVYEFGVCWRVRAHALLCMLESVEGELSLLEVPEVMRCVLRCLLEVFKMPEVMHCMLFSEV